MATPEKFKATLVGVATHSLENTALNDSAIADSLHWLKYCCCLYCIYIKITTKIRFEQTTWPIFIQVINRETLQLISEEVLWFLRSLVFTFLKSIQRFGF